MRLPKRLRVSGHEYSVLFPFKFKERTDIWGQCDSAMKEIRISQEDSCGNSVTDSHVMVTFFHEMLHAIDFATGHEVFVGEEGEKKITAISECLWQVLRDNKLLAKDLFVEKR